MNIASGSVVTLEYTLTNDQGETLESNRGSEPLVYLHGHQNIIPGLEAALAGRTVGEEFSTRIPPAEAYGELNPTLRQTLPRSDFPDDVQIEVGMRFRARTNQGFVILRVTDANDQQVSVDGNHELAGVPLTFAVKVLEVRAATSSELAHGHIHGPGCCH